MSLRRWLMVYITRKSARRFDQAADSPGEMQKTKLEEFVRRNAATEYGKRYGFADICSVSDWRKQVPIIGYEDISEEIERTLNGEANILTAEKPVLFAQTSGTTGKPKYIPVTPTCQGREHKGVMRTWLYHAFRDHAEILNGKILTMVSPAIEGYAPSGIPFGSTSGHMYKSAPSLVQSGYSIPYEVFEISDYQAKYYTIMRIALEQDVTFLTSANPSSILKLCEKADEFSESIIGDIRDGTLSRNYEIEPSIRAGLEARLSPNPARSVALEAARRKRAGSLKPRDYWPNLGLIGCWKGGTVGHYLKRFDSLFDPDGEGSVPVRDWGYLASEMRGSIPLSDEGSQGALTVRTNFYEFVELDSVAESPDDPSKWETLTVEDVEEGKEYYILITTSGGLYRYDINDIIQIAGRYKKVPQIVFMRKGRGVTNLTGEKLTVNQVIEAFENAARETNILLNHFRAEADAGKSRYVLRAEFGDPLSDGQYKTFLSEVDGYLKKANLEYKSKRDSMRLAPPVLHVMRQGWYDRERRRFAIEGKRTFQAKTIVLSADKQMTSAIRPELEKIVEQVDTDSQSEGT